MILASFRTLGRFGPFALPGIVEKSRPNDTPKAKVEATNATPKDAAAFIDVVEGIRAAL